MKVQGTEDLLRTLDRIVDGARPAAREAIDHAAEPVRARAASLARRAPGAPDLADHIVISHAKVREAGDIAAVSIGPSQEKRSDQPNRTFSQQGRYLEFGTVDTAAHPFMRPAIETEGSQAATTVPQSIWRRLTEKLR